jgi:hypothetical protein
VSAVLPLVGGMLLLAIRAAGAALLPGGGAPRSDCYLEFRVDARALTTHTAECTDGDSDCDADGACDGSCRFRVAVCLNQDDPAVPNCRPPFPPAPLVRAAERGFDQVGLSFPSFASSACGAFVSVDVPALKGKRAGRRVKTIAVSLGHPKRDRDKLRLVCRPPPGGCPATTSTTSTTTTTLFTTTIVSSTTTIGGSTTTSPASTTTSATTGTFPSTSISTTTSTTATTTTSGSTTTTTTPTGATTTTLVTSIADTGIFSGEPNTSLGDFPQVFVGNDTANAERGLLRFALIALPPGAAIVGCRLEVHMVTVNHAGPGKIYKVKQSAWTENATWNRYDGSHVWTTPGAFSLTEAASDVVVTPGVDGPVAYAPPTSGGQFTFPDMAQLCADAFANRAGHLDIMIKQDVDDPGAVAELGFSRSTDSVPAERPRLHVTFVP